MRVGHQALMQGIWTVQPDVAACLEASRLYLGTASYVDGHLAWDCS